ncbi:YheC/YheD family protein [Alicyclobacillus fodiniaquatilis]|uniref:YheC/YheD family protein n=1 Tax=Alicyclobacillus fodiniaquatilis TaxID=1661150 RepID=A0ABW4JFA8_9BACL
MNRVINAELMWLHSNGEIELVVRPVGETRGRAWPATARFASGGLPVRIVSSAVRETVIYRFPTTLTMTSNGARLGEVYAILAGESKEGFTGARLNFRDIIALGRQKRVFLYVVPTDQVTSNPKWQGYVRLGTRRWMSVPCPPPQAVYNRIPNRLLERRPSAVQARQLLANQNIPLFNPEYFSKSKIYEMLIEGGMADFLPDTVSQLTQADLYAMLYKHMAVYLKPSGGSVGHGMLRIEANKGKWAVFVLKHGRTTQFICESLEDVWQTVCRQRVPGKYVIQQAIRTLEYRGQSCDFRVLLQKRSGAWEMVGRGVRVSGAGTITTHVPNGGSIADANVVLAGAFGAEALRVGRNLEQAVVRAAVLIDQRYGGNLGEMSMDIGIDERGQPWFFEANAKPMKFDEPDIRKKSLEGVLQQLHERAFK